MAIFELKFRKKEKLFNNLTVTSDWMYTKWHTHGITPNLLLISLTDYSVRAKYSILLHKLLFEFTKFGINVT